MVTDYSNISYENFKVRGPIVDGIFYPDDDLLLHNKVELLIENSRVQPGRSSGIISPHAAFAFSGELAAASFQSAAEREVDKVIIIAPVHRDYTERIFLTESDFFSIPTANIKVDTETVNKLLEYNPLFQINDIPHLEEHCIEIQLPFIAHLFPEAEIIPILIGNNSSKLVLTLVDAIKKVFNDNFEKTLIVASSNIVSYLEQDTAHQYCEYLLDIIKTGNHEKLIEEVDRCKLKSKGLSTIASLLLLTGKDAGINILRTRDSAKTGKDSGKVVCYAAISVNKENRVT